MVRQGHPAPCGQALPCPLAVLRTANNAYQYCKWTGSIYFVNLHPLKPLTTLIFAKPIAEYQQLAFGIFAAENGEQDILSRPSVPVCSIIRQNRLNPQRLRLRTSDLFQRTEVERLTLKIGVVGDIILPAMN